MDLEIQPPINQFRRFPGTRYMGSKNKIILDLWNRLEKIDFESSFDAFAGSNVVSYFLKCQGKEVFTNDFMAFSFITSKAIIENAHERLTKDDIELILRPNQNNGFIQKTFKGIFFTDEENKFLDRARKKISGIRNEFKSALALSALVRACLKKRSRGIFTFSGERYNDGRLDMKKSIEQHFVESAALLNNAVFDNGKKNRATNLRTEDSFVKADLLYLDPPYFTPNSDNDYLRRYHFVEGLVKNWEGLEIEKHSLVRKFKSYHSPFAKKKNVYDAFDQLFAKYKDSVFAISYSSNGIPTKDELTKMIGKYKSDVSISEIDHTYSFGNQNHKTGNLNNRVKEYLFIGT